MKKLYGYVRVSDHKQKKGASLEAQKTDIKRFVEAEENQTIEWCVEQQTAAKKGRPVYDQMIADLRAGKADGVVIHKINRASRNWFDWAELIELADSGVQVAFAVERIDLSTDKGRLTADIYQAIATNTIRDLRSEAKKGQGQRLRDGLYPFHTPLGYTNAGKHTGKPKTPHPEKAAKIRHLFQLYATGEYSYRALLKAARQIKLLSHKGKPITKHTLEIMLSNPFYCGIIHIQRSGETFQGRHQPIVSLELFKQVQQVRANRQFKKNTRHNHLFRGLFKCQKCSRGMIAERQKGHVYYRCHTRDCQHKYVREDTIDAMVISALKGFAISNKFLATVSDKVMHWHCPSSRKWELRAA